MEISTDSDPGTQAVNIQTATPTDLEVSGHPASGTTGVSGTMLRVHLDGLRGQDGTVLFAVLVGAHPSITHPMAVLESVAAQILGGM